jgi:glucosamine kinase
VRDGDIFCVDAGGSRCRGRLVGPAAHVLAEAEDGPCNPSTDFAAAVASLARLWQRAAAAGGRDPAAAPEVTLALGGAGLGTSAMRRRFLAALPRFGRSVVMGDGYAALIGAGGGAPCGLIIAGTGVVGHRLYPDGRSIERDGWGWIGGDRGSGAWIGQRALRHALAALDGLVAFDPLVREVIAAVRTASPEPRGWIAGLGPERLAALAPLVLAAEREGDPVAAGILDEAVGWLAGLAGTLDLGAGDTLYLAGGLAETVRPRLAARLRRSVAEPAADARHGAYLVATGAAPAESPLAGPLP